MGLPRRFQAGISTKRPVAMWNRDNARPCRIKEVKGLFLASHEEVPSGFGLRTGDHSDTADGIGN